MTETLALAGVLPGRGLLHLPGDHVVEGVAGMDLDWRATVAFADRSFPNIAILLAFKRFSVPKILNRIRLLGTEALNADVVIGKIDVQTLRSQPASQPGRA
ncbi:hypothetical protein KIV56_03960 [Cryobacterium breve]|uniref:Uncharacterized protein n=1 Tax=Cryobacterium breve TaxID=1259258 RepID=A0ABY7NF06_9MICO|nr:hypothetical protein [Cryobacterium breve]WBM80592.1 hypothetical protein KIV56_03960 [Cryobacterium breve]